MLPENYLGIYRQYIKALRGKVMSKAILVIDMPSCCNECSLMCQDEYSYYCPVKCEENKTDLYDNYIMFHRKPDWCPLKPEPLNRNVRCGNEIADAWLRGYEHCLRKILGEED